MASITTPNSERIDQVDGNVSNHSCGRKLKIFNVVISFIPLMWAKYHLSHSFLQLYDCKALMDLPSRDFLIILFIGMALCIHPDPAFVSARNRKTTYSIVVSKVAVNGLTAIMVAFYVVFFALMLGVYEFSPPPPPLGLLKYQNHKNNSAYWNENIKSCFCTTPTCEDLVYKTYMLNVAYNMSRYEGDVKVLKDESTTNPRYHEVCYLATGSCMEKKLCYHCQGCEEEILAILQRRVWQLKGVIYTLWWLLIFAIIIVVVDELWACYEEYVESKRVSIFPEVDSSITNCV